MQIHEERLKWNASPRVGSLDNKTYRPGGGEVSIINETPRWQATPKVGSLDNAHYQPTGGNVSIVNDPRHYQSDAKVHSMDNVHYKPGGGDIKVPIKIMPYPIGSLNDLPHPGTSSSRSSPRSRSNVTTRRRRFSHSSSIHTVA